MAKREWKGKRVATNQIVMKLDAVRANISGKDITKLKNPCTAVASSFTLILVTGNVNIHM